MSDEIDGGPFVPSPEMSQSHYGIPDAYRGLTIRDYFAAKATDKDIEAVGDEQVAAGCGRPTRQEARYIHADQMLAARKAVRK